MSVLDSAPVVTAHTSPQPPAGWAELVDSDPGADFFHTGTWTQAACTNYPNLEPVWLTAEIGGKIAGGLVALRRTRSLPLLVNVDHLDSNLEGTSGGPLVGNDLPASKQVDVFKALVEAILSQRRGILASCSISLNTRSENRFGHLLHNDPRWLRRDVPGAVIDLDGGQEQVEMNRMKKSKRNEKNRGLKRGVEVFTTNDLKWLDGYYHIYQEASQKWGVAPVPAGFLRDLLQSGPERAFFTCVKLEDRVIGGHLNLVHGDRVIAWNGVTDPAFARSHFPATIAVWWDIVESCARGARWLDLGASGGVVTLSGFKKYFGAEMEGRGFYVNNSGGMKLLRGTRDRLARLKLFLSPVAEPGRWHDGQTRDKATGEDQEKAEGS